VAREGKQKGTQGASGTSVRKKWTQKQGGWRQRKDRALVKREKGEGEAKLGITYPGQKVKLHHKKKREVKSGLGKVQRPGEKTKGQGSSAKKHKKMRFQTVTRAS